MMKKPWWVALFQVVAETWLAFTLKIWAPSRYHRICSGDTLRSCVGFPGEARGPVGVPPVLPRRPPAVLPHRVGGVAGLATAAGPLATADPGGLVALAARVRSTVECRELGAASVDVLEDVDLA